MLRGEDSMIRDPYVTGINCNRLTTLRKAANSNYLVGMDFDFARLFFHHASHAFCCSIAKQNGHLSLEIDSQAAKVPGSTFSRSIYHGATSRNHCVLSRSVRCSGMAHHALDDFHTHSHARNTVFHSLAYEWISNNTATATCLPSPRYAKPTQSST
jgi:hypothetical protein